MVLPLNCVLGQSNLPVYADQLTNGWQNRSWGVNSFVNLAPMHSGTYSISASENAWEAIAFRQADFNIKVRVVAVPNETSYSSRVNKSPWLSRSSRATPPGLAILLKQSRILRLTA